MTLRVQNYVLGFAALLCFIDGFLAPKGSDPGPALTAVMGILLVRRAVIITPQPTVVIVAGCVLARNCFDGKSCTCEHKQRGMDRIDAHRGTMLWPLGENRKTLELAQLT